MLDLFRIPPFGFPTMCLGLGRRLLSSRSIIRHKRPTSQTSLGTTSNPSSTAIMSLVPLCQLRNRNLDKFVALRPMVKSQNLLTDSVPTNFWKNPDPGPVIESTAKYDSNASHDICGVPERHVTLSAWWWIPRHDEEEEINEDGENDDYIPGVKHRTRKIQATPTPTNNEQTDG